MLMVLAIVCSQSDDDMFGWPGVLGHQQGKPPPNIVLVRCALQDMPMVVGLMHHTFKSTAAARKPHPNPCCMKSQE